LEKKESEACPESGGAIQATNAGAEGFGVEAGKKGPIRPCPVTGKYGGA